MREHYSDDVKHNHIFLIDIAKSHKYRKLLVQPPSFDVQLSPMEIRTFELKVHYN